MQEKLIIRYLHNGMLDVSEADHTDEKPLLLLSGVDCLEEVISGTDKRDVILLISPASLIFRAIPLPEKNGKLTSERLSWLAEETLLGESDALHWTVLHREQALVHAVAIDSGWLRSLLSAFNEAGLNIVYAGPDGLYLPAVDNSWTAIRLQDDWLLRLGPYQLTSLDENWFRHLREQWAPQKIVSYSPLEHEGLLVESLPWQSPQQLLHTSGLALPSLLHGDFRPRQPTKPVNKAVRYAAFASCVMAVFLMLLSKGLGIWHLHQESAALNQETKALYQQHFPQDKRNSNYRFFFNQKISAVSPDVLTRLTQLQRHLEAYPSLQIQRIHYQQEQDLFDVQLLAGNAEHLQQFIQESEQEFHFTMDKTPADGDSVTVKSVFKK
ncbi:type II secretion system protein GspL [Chimaeribacter arupi]|uniref:Type II secretion system protein GspL n=1 Tax=Chimaeribacter arupi TaxID=2060066 RepID=A0A2N5EHV2_9GAMM|nr:type II secretion system protein GspL [Chimaeribacter arupi]PLR43893.1 type II secretion system protein GspL [Chimaeribacter arupi]